METSRILFLSDTALETEIHCPDSALVVYCNLVNNLEKPEN